MPKHVGMKYGYFLHIFCICKMLVFNNLKHIIFYGMNIIKILITSYKNCKSNLSEMTNNK